jgi:hypothetical protein
VTKPASDKTTTGQRPYPKVLRHPSPIEYQTLILTLARSAQRVDDGGDALSEAYVCLQRVFEFINNDPQAQAAVMPGPLNTLANALYDLAQGANPKLFAKPKKGPGKPTNLASRELPRAYIAAAMASLMDGGESKQSATDWTVEACNQLGIRIGGKPIDAEHVQQWRDEFNGHETRSEQAIDLYKHVRAKQLPGFDPRGMALLWLEFVARNFPG